jgi:copper chaperone CopZ
MTCGHCAQAVQKKLSSTPGVSKVQVDLEGARATVEFDPAVTDRKRLAAAVESLGYGVPATA